MAEEGILTIIDTKGRNFVVKMPDNYPFSPPTINGALINKNPWSPAKTILQAIKRAYSEGDEPEMLIYCHRKEIVLADPASHWQVKIFKEIRDEHLPGTEPKVASLEINPEANSTFITDGFGLPFLTQNQNMFDIVMLPDCGGPWEELQHPGPNVPALVEMVKNVLQIVKPGGRLYVGKLLSWAGEEGIIATLTAEGFEVTANIYYPYDPHRSRPRPPGYAVGNPWFTWDRTGAPPDQPAPDGGVVYIEIVKK